MKYLKIGFLTLLTALSACHRQPAPVVVHMFRDHEGARGRNIDTTISAIALQQPTTSDGSPIMIVDIEFRNYKEALPMLKGKFRSDIVIFNSREDWIAATLAGESTDLPCAPKVTCVAMIPSWTTGKTREASGLVLTMMRIKLK